MGKKLYVGNLSYDVTDDQLNALFAPLGQVVSAKVIMDRDSGRSKGFGFVEMSSDDEAKVAIEKMNGNMSGNRKIVVNEARPMEERPPRSGGFGGGRGGDRGGGNRQW